MRLAIAMLVALVAAPLAAQPTVRSIFKEPVTGKIRKLDGQGRLEIEVKGSDVPERIGLDEVEQISFGNKGDERKPEDSPLRVYLVNGDVLYGQPDNAPDKDEDKFVLRGARFGELVLSIQMVKRIEFVPNVQPNVLPELEAGVTQDVTYFAASGGKPAQTDPAAELVRIVKDGAYIYNEILDDDAAGTKYLWAKLRGVVCFRSRHNAYDKLLAIAMLRDGSLLRGPISSWEGGKVVIDHKVLGRQIVLEETSLLSITMKNGRFQYLSDIEFARAPEERPYYLPSDFKYDDYLFKVRRDQAQGGGPISIRGRTYAKGLGVHALSKLTFDVNRGYKRLLAEVGLDDSAGDLASVEFKIYADGKLIWESGVLRRSSGAKAIDIDILNANQIVLEVTAADNADIQDRANWANAKLVR
ncbi:MAG: NPCBM/NEW2 domain-containing protein [Planctomycetes bacterium]|nr:NPCBM/NEW2 domain-containing protein [Planctomycetota bacterium]